MASSFLSQASRTCNPEMRHGQKSRSATFMTLTMSRSAARLSYSKGDRPEVICAGSRGEIDHETRGFPSPSCDRFGFGKAKIVGPDRPEIAPPGGR